MPFQCVALQFCIKEAFLPDLHKTEQQCKLGVVMAWTMIFLNALILYMCLLLGPAAAVNGELTI